MPQQLTLAPRKAAFDYKPSSKKDKDLLEWLGKCIAESSIFCEPEHVRIEENQRYERGYQWSEGDAQRQKDKERPALPLNDISKGLSSVANREIMDRYMPKVFGRETDDDGKAELLDELSRWQRDASETEHEESRAFRQVCASGYGVMHKYWNDVAADGQGMVSDEEVPIWTMLWDPRARKQNLVDRKYHINGKYVAIQDIIDQFGDKRGAKKKLKAIQSSGSKGNGGVGGGSSSANSRWGWRDVVQGRWFVSSRQELFLTEFEWVENKSVWNVAYPVRWDEWNAFVNDPQGMIQYGADEAGQPLAMQMSQYSSLPDADKKNLASAVLYDTDTKIIDKREDLNLIQEPYFEFTGQELEFSKKMKEEVQFAIVTKDIVLARGVRKMGFTYEFVTGIPFEQRDGTRFYGFVDMAKGPQDFKNVLYSNLLTQYMASPKGTLIMEEGLIENSNEFMNDYSKLGGIMFVADGVVGQMETRSKEIQGGQFPNMPKELLAIVESGVEAMLGINSLDGDLRRISVKVADQANRASSTILAIYFDSLKRYRKRFGLLNLKFLQQAYDVKEMARIVGGEVGQFLAEVEEWPEVNRFDIKVEENPTTVSEQIDAMKTLISSGTLANWTDGPNPKLAFTDAVDMMISLPKSTREKIKRNSKQMEEFSSTIEQLQNEVNTKDEQIKLRDQWLLSVDRGGELNAAWQTVYGMALEVDRQRQEMIAAREQEQQAQQGGAPQPPQ
jgi:hypothetical protein